MSILDKKFEIKGMLEAKVLAEINKAPISGVDLLKTLNLRSDGTIYPLLKNLQI